MSQRVVAIIQARMGGDRLPGKVLLPLGGKPMLQNVVERVQRAKLVEVVVAVPWGDLSKLAFIGHQTHVTFTECSGIAENDIIRRYCEAAKGYDLIVRIGADNPCVEPEIIDLTIEVAQHEKRDDILITTAENPDKNHDGFGGEIYTIKMLKMMDDEIISLEYREHPHKFWYANGRYSYPGDKYPPGFRLDVNTEADYEKLKRIYDHFGHNRFTVNEVIEFLNGKNDMEERAISARG